MALLEVDGIELAYGRRQVLFGVNIEVGPAEVVALLGTNGAGKTSLLRAVSGLARPRRGVVRLDGHDITRLSPHRRTEQGLVFVPAGPALPGLTVEENLRLGGYAIRRDRAAVSAGMDRVRETFPDLAARWHQEAGRLSGGQQQMLNIGRALMVAPRLLLIDELSLGLAPAVAAELVVLIRALAEQGTSVLVVEQNARFAARLAQRGYFLERGQVRFAGCLDDLLGRGDLLRSVFLGPGTNGFRRGDRSLPTAMTTVRTREEGME